jgi:hypothetical protein
MQICNLQTTHFKNQLEGAIVDLLAYQCKMPSSTVAVATVELLATPSTSRAIENFKKPLHNNEIKKKIDNFIEKWFLN